MQPESIDDHTALPVGSLKSIYHRHFIGIRLPFDPEDISDHDLVYTQEPTARVGAQVIGIMQGE